MKFGLLIATDILIRRTSPYPKPEVKLRHSGRHHEIRYNIITLPRMDRMWIKLGILVHLDAH